MKFTPPVKHDLLLQTKVGNLRISEQEWDVIREALGRQFILPSWEALGRSNSVGYIQLENDSILNKVEKYQP